MTQPCIGELFAGIGGFGLAAERAGFRVAWASEIDNFASRVYGTRFPSVRQLGDVTKIEDAEIVDCITAGFPCQDLSVAGKRKGLVGERSGLFWHITRIAQRLRPRWLLLENVPGLLSSHRGRDFETVIAALDDIGYGVAWRVLDAQFFGVPQRRRRVFIVGHLGSPCPAEVLFEPEGVPGDTAAGREAGAGVTQALTRSLGAGGADDNDAQGGLIVIEDAGRKMSGGARVGLGISEGGPCYTHQAGSRHAVAMPLRAGRQYADMANGESNIVAHQCHGSNVGKMGTLRAGNGNEAGGVPFIAHTLKGEGFDGGEDGTGRGTPIVAQPIRTNVYNNSDPGMEARGLILAPTLRVGGREQGAGSSSDNTPLVAAPITAAYGTKWNGNSGAFSGENFATIETRPRRLTPRECERLQGFPDDWTLIEGASDSARYRALGNAVAVPCVEWILKRLVGAGARG